MTRKALLTSTAISPLDSELLTRPDEFERERTLYLQIMRDRDRPGLATLSQVSPLSIYRSA